MGQKLTGISYIEGLPTDEVQPDGTIQRTRADDMHHCGQPTQSTAHRQSWMLEPGLVRARCTASRISVQPSNTSSKSVTFANRSYINQPLSGRSLRSLMAEGRQQPSMRTDRYCHVRRELLGHRLGSPHASFSTAEQRE